MALRRFVMTVSTRKAELQFVSRLRWWLDVELHILIPVHTRTSRNQVTDDDVLLEAKPRVLCATNRRVGAHCRRQRSHWHGRLRGRKKVRRAVRNRA